MDGQFLAENWTLPSADGRILKILVILTPDSSAGWDPGYHPGEDTLYSALARMVDPIRIRRIVAGWLDGEFSEKQ